MLACQGYEPIENIGSTDDIRLYRMLRLADRQVVIAKTTCEEYPSSAVINSFRQEYNILQNLNGNGAAKAYQLELTASRPILFMEDIGGTTLDKLMRNRTDFRELASLLTIAAAVADSLRQLHDGQIMLNGLTPFHMMVNPDRGEAKLIDIRMCTVGGSPAPQEGSAGRLDAALAYISPEQTGRTGLKPDYRSNLYSLGIILYEWFAGQLPFASGNALDLVYQHLASKPLPLHECAPSIPQAVSDIVAKCMEKMPQSRYATAYGIKNDLELCLTRLRLTGTIEPFLLADDDQSDQWQIPAGFSGRQAEQECLRQVLRQAAGGPAEIIWITGSGGIGKTSFVEETFRTETSSVGFFARGKSDSSGLSQTYELWIQAIDQLVGQLLTVSMLQLEVWKLRITNALGDYGQLLTGLVPRLELLIGEQPPVRPLPPLEAQHQLHQLLSRFLQLFLDKTGQPLVLFFDDLQWADEASLQYLAYLLGDWETKHLLVIGAFRDEDLTPQHPLSILKHEFDKRSRKVGSIHLEGVTSDDFKQLVGNALHGEGAGIDELAAALYHKTEGHPLFFKRFLQDLIDEKHVFFDKERRTWNWDLLQIREMDIPDNVADYILAKLTDLPSNAVYALGCAALLGNSFDFDVLVTLTGYSRQELSEVLDLAVRERFLFTVDKDNPFYKFQHDRILQAAYLLVPADDRSSLHWTIGSLLADRRDDGEGISVFEVVRHFNQMPHMLLDQEQKLILADFNLQAGLSAKQATAYETARSYLQLAAALLQDSDWETHYDLTFRCYQELAAAEYQCASFAAANEWFELTLSKASTRMDKALVCILKIQLEASKDNHQEVLAWGKKALEWLGIRHNFNPGSVHLALQWFKLRKRLARHSADSIGSLPPMTDDMRMTAMSVFLLISNSCIFIDHKTWASNVFAMLELTLDYGMTPEASIGFAGLALMQYYTFKDDKESYKWAKVACQLSRPYPLLYVKSLTVFSLCYTSWRRYEPDFMTTFSEYAGKVGLESGDLWQSNQSVLFNCGMLVQCGYPLDFIYERLLAHASNFQKNDNIAHWKMAVILTEMIVRLSGNRAAEDPYAAEDVVSADFVHSVHGDEFHTAQELLYTMLYTTNYLFGDYHAAAHAVSEMRALISKRKSDDEHFGHNVYASLVWARLYEDAGAKDRSRYLVDIRRNLKSMKPLVNGRSSINIDKYFLVQAEYARIRGKHRQAGDFYEKAIDEARKSGHTHDGAIAAECYGRYGLQQGKIRLAQIYMTEAYESYMKWGAAAKADELKKQYGHLLQLQPVAEIDRVDYLSVAQSSQILSGEIEMGRLLHTSLRLMLQNAGAEYGALVFADQEKWTVEIYGTTSELHLQSIALEVAGQLVSTAIIAYAARTQEEVVLFDAAAGGMFAMNPYVKDNRLKSVLCLPIMHQNKLICLLYMENKLSAGIFSSERLDVLRMIGTQCAISIENARLYSGIQELKNSLEDQVEERTQRLQRSMQETSAALAEMSIYAERNRIAQEIHDIVGHTLTSTILQIEAGKRLLSKDMPEAVKRLQEAQHLVRNSLNEIRGSVHMMKEDRFFHLKLALEQLIDKTVQNMDVDVAADIQELPPLSGAYKKAIYFALQEGLTNGIRHGECTAFRFSLENTENYLRFRLENNGKSGDEIIKGFGLKAMEERVLLLGGNLSIHSGAEHGYLLKIDLPYTVQLQEAGE
ncbi:AAA family ATPase [Paenibacillus nasutitermitis]|uniref:Serine/threonine protein kinase n=1 Tax=Paenibacillus nasutitermitis TaxID=1652958 RepID=A0A916ZDH8_9BACL|nr:AAA family ATPase [Paenibacillus nasutitermitis]GGD89104.1 serine/threonine protein kinase [Paenibacillus nasutitermitis]